VAGKSLVGGSFFWLEDRGARRKRPLRVQYSLSGERKGGKVMFLDMGGKTVKKVQKKKNQTKAGDIYF